jgi:hypothetical protein
MFKEIPETEMIKLARQRRERATEACEAASEECVDFCNAFLPKDILSQFAGPDGRGAMEMVALGFDPSTLKSTWVEAGRRAQAFLSATLWFRILSARLARARAEEDAAWEVQNDAIRRQLEAFCQLELA